MNASTRLGLLFATVAVGTNLVSACGSSEPPDPPPPVSEQVPVVEPSPDCPPPGIKLRRDPGCW